MLNTALKTLIVKPMCCLYNSFPKSGLCASQERDKIVYRDEEEYMFLNRHIITRIECVLKVLLLIDVLGSEA